MSDDLRCYRYRAKAGRDGDVEARMFISALHVPADEGWEDSPAKVAPIRKRPVAVVLEPEVPEDEPSDDSARQALIEQAEALGITVDGRWGDERLADEIAAAEKAE